MIEEIKTDKKRKLIVEVLILNIIVLIIWAIYVKFEFREASSWPEMTMNQWTSELAIYDVEKEAWYIDSEMVDNPEHANRLLLVGPMCEMEKGEYTISIDYSSESTQTLKLSCSENVRAKYDWSQLSPILDKTQTHLDYDFYIDQDVQDFVVYINYNGYDSFSIYRISISKNLNSVKRGFFWVICLLATVDVFAFRLNRIKANRKTLLIITGSGLLSSAPLFVHGMLGGHDLIYHLMRIDGLATDITYGKIPVRMDSTWLQGFGYPFSIYYCDLFLYFPAILRHLGFDITFAYKIYVFVVNILTAVVAYKAFKIVFKSEKMGLLLSAIYVLNPYRLLDLYIRCALGEYTAMLFFPIVLLGMYYIYERDSSNRKDILHNALVLAFGMAGIIMCHVLSTEMVCVFLIVFCLINYRKTFSKNVIQTYLSAVAITVLLTAWFLIPFIDYTLSVDVAINRYMDGSVRANIQNSGAYILQLLSIFQSPYGFDNADISVRTAQTPGLISVLTVCASIYLLITPEKEDCKGKKKLAAWTFITLLFTFMSTDLFPWNGIESLGMVGRFLVQVQYPMRYLGIVSIGTIMIVGIILQDYMKEDLKHRFSVVIIGLAVLSTLVFFSQYSDLKMNSVHRDTADLGVFSEWTYVLQNCNSGDVGRRIMGDGFSKAEIINKTGALYEIAVVAGENGAHVDVPFFNYKGYEAWDDSGNKFPISDGYNRDVLVELPVNYEGIIKVGFVEPWYWGFCTIISLVTVVVTIICLIKYQSEEKLLFII